MKHSLPLAVLPLLALTLLLLAACSSGGSATPEPAATTASTQTEGAPPSSTTAIAAEAGGPTGPGPQAGVACPVAVQLCEFAVQVQQILDAGDSDGFFAIANAVPATCTGVEANGGPSSALCEGAAANEVRDGFWALQGAQSRIVSEAELRDTLTRWHSSSARATGSDVYGPGEMRIGAISCTRLPEHRSGICRGTSIQIHYTFINPAEEVDHTGLPSQRITFHVSALLVDGQLRLNGFGTVEPPNNVLVPGVYQSKDPDGTPTILEVYPWTY